MIQVESSARGGKNYTSTKAGQSRYDPTKLLISCDSTSMIKAMDDLQSSSQDQDHSSAERGQTLLISPKI